MGQPFYLLHHNIRAAVQMHLPQPSHSLTYVSSLRVGIQKLALSRSSPVNLLTSLQHIKKMG